MRQARIGEDVLYYGTGEKRDPLPAKIIRMSGNGRAVLMVFADYGAVVRQCFHVGAEWNKKNPAYAKREGVWDFCDEEVPQDDVQESEERRNRGRRKPVEAV